MELKELKDMIEPVENWEYELSGTRQVGKSYMQNLLNNKDKVINDLLKRISDLEFEVERLEDAINELEKYSEDMIKEYNEEIQKVDNNIDKFNLLGAKSSYREISNKIKELKGSVKK